MNQVSRLLRELSPSGVEFRPLGDLVRVRNGKDHKALLDGSIPVYGSGGVMRHVDRAAHPGPSVLIPRKGSLGSLYYVDRPFWTVDTIFYTEVGASLEPKFLFYYLQAQHLEDLNQAGGVPSLTQSVLNAVRMPVPPLEVQREIVRILDTFTDLEAELEAELEARRRHYAHYSEIVLRGGSEASWRKVKLREVVELLIGFPFKSKQFSNDAADIRLVRGDNVGQGSLKGNGAMRWRRQAFDNLERFELREGDVLLAMDRPWIPAGLKWARIATDDLPALLVQRVACLRARSEWLDQDFLGWVISSARFTAHVLEVQTGNTVPHISGDSILEFPFSLPPLQDQTRIAEQLSSLYALVNDLSIGLPAELAARRKQYEYYRDKLLTFEELSA